MALSKEQAVQIKKQLFEQLKDLPQENKAQVMQHIENLDETQLEVFLKQNNISMESDAPQESQEPIFSQIIEGKIPSYKIAENDKALAILELNPVSKGHIIVLPKEQTSIEKLPKAAMTLAQKIAQKIKIKLKPDDIKIETASFQEYPFINIIPLYKETKLEKKQALETELKQLQNKLETKLRAKRTPKPKTIRISNLPEISFRIP